MSMPSSVATDHGNDQRVQACTAPTPWFGLVIALLLLVAAASLAFLYFKP